MLGFLELSISFLVVVIIIQPALKELRLQTCELTRPLEPKEQESLRRLRNSNATSLTIATWIALISLFQFLLLPLGEGLASSIRFSVAILLSLSLVSGSAFGRLIFNRLVRVQILFYQFILDYANQDKHLDETVIRSVQQSVESRLYHNASQLIKGLTTGRIMIYIAIILFTALVSGETVTLSSICLTFGLMVYAYRSDKLTELA